MEIQVWYRLGHISEELMGNFWGPGTVQREKVGHSFKQLVALAVAGRDERAKLFKF